MSEHDWDPTTRRCRRCDRHVGNTFPKDWKCTMTHRWESLAGYCTRCGLSHEIVWRDTRLTECRPDVVVGMAARRPGGIVVERFDESRVTITTDDGGAA